jgi:hypothetical protein
MKRKLYIEWQGSLQNFRPALTTTSFTVSFYINHTARDQRFVPKLFLLLIPPFLTNWQRSHQDNFNHTETKSLKFLFFFFPGHKMASKQARVQLREMIFARNEHKLVTWANSPHWESSCSGLQKQKVRGKLTKYGVQLHKASLGEVVRGRSWRVAAWNVSVRGTQRFGAELTGERGAAHVAAVQHWPHWSEEMSKRFDEQGVKVAS